MKDGKFEIGDRVRRLPHHWNGGGMFTGFEGVITRINHNGNIIHFDQPNGGWDADKFVLVEEADVPDNAPRKEEEKHMITRFVFCSRGGKYYGKGDYDSLEKAHKRCLALRKLYRSDKIYSFVIVEE